MVHNQLQCTKCKHVWNSEWPWRDFGWDFECSKCGAKGRDIKLVGKVEEPEEETKYDPVRTPF